MPKYIIRHTDFHRTLGEYETIAEAVVALAYHRLECACGACGVNTADGSEWTDEMQAEVDHAAEALALGEIG